MKSTTPIPPFSTKNLCFYSGEYSFGFNGKDKESEFNSGAYDFGARIHDARLGRWMSVDPKNGEQPNQSTYKSFLNNPCVYVDPSGETEFYQLDQNGNKVLIKTVKDGSTATFVLKKSLVNSNIVPNQKANKAFVFDGYSNDMASNGVKVPNIPFGSGNNQESFNKYFKELDAAIQASHFINVPIVVQEQYDYTVQHTEPGQDKAGKATYCNTNFFTSLTALTNNSMDLYAPSNHQQANNINQEIDDYKLNEKDLFTPVSWDQAVELARKGEFVVASAYNSKGSGHITILDDDQSNVQSKDDIMLLNVGSVNGRLSLKSVWSASSREKVSFYVLNKEAVAK